jgi:hypothetical protein
VSCTALAAQDGRGVLGRFHLHPHHAPQVARSQAGGDFHGMPRSVIGVSVVDPVVHRLAQKKPVRPTDQALNKKGPSTPTDRFVVCSGRRGSVLITMLKPASRTRCMGIGDTSDSEKAVG